MGGDPLAGVALSPHVYIILLAKNPCSPQEYLCKRLQKKCGKNNEGYFEVTGLIHCTRRKLPKDPVRVGCDWFSQFPCSFFLAIH